MNANFTAVTLAAGDAYEHNGRYHSTSFDVLQIENLLISNQGTVKLCDFGSATTVSHYPDYSWSAQKRSMVEDEVQTHTYTHTHTHKHWWSVKIKICLFTGFPWFNHEPRLIVIKIIRD